MEQRIIEINHKLEELIESVDMLDKGKIVKSAFIRTVDDLTIEFHSVDEDKNSVIVDFAGSFVIIQHQSLNGISTTVYPAHRIRGIDMVDF